MKHAALLPLLIVMGCDTLLPSFVVQRCQKEWVCEGDVAFDDTEDFCVNANDATAVEEQKTSFETAFAEDCGGVIVTCDNGAVEPTCQATCTLTQEPCADAGT